MKRPRIETLTDEELVVQFEIWARARGQAILDGKVPAANRSFDKLHAVDQALRGRGVLSRRKLLSLLDHTELTVRFHAAERLLAVEPARAREVLAEVRAMGPRYPLALDAGMTLLGLDDGS